MGRGGGPDVPAGRPAPHRNLPLPSLLRLLVDSSERVAEAAAASPYLPVERMEWLLTRAGL
ncbi:hypothetical protein [Streptomyces sp. Y1]|uniref:Uncharacterized protein n=1 Tax=Streptomyces sp. Y1 TaxID=3238634 RepID=A0AB39TWC0_9ACTN